MSEFISYEYKEMIADVEKASFLLDCYENFGWQQDEKLSGNVKSTYQTKVRLQLKRNRKIVNKMELTRLQRNFEACTKEIETLEQSKTSSATMYSLVVGVVGTAFMAGSVFAVTAQPPQILLCILLGIPAIIGWILPLFVYRKLAKQTEETIAPLIEAKYDEIDEICEKGHRLLGL